MQNYCKTIGALAAASALVAGNASAEVEYELHTGYTNQYLFRGNDLGDDLIEAGVNASGQVAGLDLKGGIWHGSFSDSASTSWQETDLCGEVAKDLGFATVAVGYIWYTYPENNTNDQQEVYFSVARDFGFLEASLAYYWDVEDGGLPDFVGSPKSGNDGYMELGLSKSFEINSCLSLGIATNVGYQAERAQLTAWTTKATLDWGFAEKAKLSPFVAISTPLNGDNDSDYTYKSDQELIAGSMLSVSF